MDTAIRTGDSLVSGTPAYRARDDGDSPTLLPAVLRRTAWGAIIVGTLAACGLQLILSVLGVAIGVSARDPNTGASLPGLQNISMMAGIWWLITGMIALFVGGLCLGRVAGINRSTDLLLHGFAMWCLTAVLGLVLVSGGIGLGAAGAAAAMQPRDWQAGSTRYGWAADRGGADRGLDNRSAGNRGMDHNSGTADASGNKPVDMDEAPGVNTRVGSTDQHTQDNISRADSTPTEVARTISWWTFFALVLGVAASLAGTWVAAPEKSLVLPSGTPS